MPTVVDLHVHTVRGSRDSSLAPEGLIQRLAELQVRGAVLAEHDGWFKTEFDSFAEQQKHLLVNAREIYTDMGHVIAIGLHGYGSAVQKLERLRELADAAGAFLILAHPFRFLLDPAVGVISRNILFPDPADSTITPEMALRHPVFSLIDEIEGLNAANNDQENAFAMQVAYIRRSPGTGGSDAHSDAGICRCATRFEDDITNERELIEALRARRYAPVERVSSNVFCTREVTNVDEKSMCK